jgi:hypothetical protein
MGISFFSFPQNLELRKFPTALVLVVKIKFVETQYSCCTENVSIGKQDGIRRT